ncbi:uncharacterized protein M6B38_417590 [Iris pallida]|uniref:Wall-associated receptor kinase galacturonan-binding domain-containing protein n=1 Tax=Iris pallida TaxID=29817 RepID=A0AAX6FJ62_IRIPA|nr:uncharacterized protein M6B38_417590 [Iris pallida]
MNSSDLLAILLLLLLLTPSRSQSCKRSCGVFPIHYPFGTGPGCGSPAFHPHVACDEGRNLLLFTTRTGSYPVQSIDYANQVLYVQDPSLSTCSSAGPSPGFSLDWDAPFSFRDGDVFALLGCPPSLSSSSPNSTLCDAANAPICTLLYSCPAVASLGAPVSACCVYAPASLGPSYEMDLGKLRCAAYSAIYSFNGAEGDPERWKFGIALRYRFSVDDGYPSACADCERTDGACGYAAGRSNSFVCNCGNGVNTTTNCYYARWNVDSDGQSLPPPLSIGFKLIFSWWVMAWILL